MYGLKYRDGRRTVHGTEGRSSLFTSMLSHHREGIARASGLSIYRPRFDAGLIVYIMICRHFSCRHGMTRDARKMISRQPFHAYCALRQTDMLRHHRRAELYSYSVAPAVMPSFVFLCRRTLLFPELLAHFSPPSSLQPVRDCRASDMAQVPHDMMMICATPCHR